jgi:Domain of unknown function (DUF5658)
MIYIALILFTILNFTDFAVTTIAIHYLGFEIEGNTMLRHAMENAGSIWPMFAAKVANTAFAMLTYYVTRNHRRSLLVYTWLLFGVCATLAYAIILGILILRDL